MTAPDRKALAETARKAHEDAMMALAADVHPYSPGAVRDNEEAMDTALAALAEPCQECERWRDSEQPRLDVSYEAQEGWRAAEAEVAALREKLAEAEHQIKTLSYGREAELTRANFWQPRAEQAERQLEQAREALRISYPKTPVDCLLSTLSELESFVYEGARSEKVITHVLDAVREAREALAAAEHQEACPVCGCVEWDVDYYRTEDGEMRVDTCSRCGWPPSYPVSVEEWRKKQGIAEHPEQTA